MSKRTLCTVAGLGLLLAASPAPAGSIRFVDDDAAPGGDGLSWPTAYRFLQDALADAVGAAGSVSEIRVGQGLYHADRDEADPLGSGDRTASFALVVGVALRGGFAGLGAPDPDARDVSRFPSILSGDLAGNDAPGDFPFGPSFVDNTYHLVTATSVGSETALDGFTVRAGSSGPGSPTGRGGGMMLFAANPTVTDCTFLGNAASVRGGAIATELGSPAITGCAFSFNRSNFTGGAIGVDGGQPSIVDSSFTENQVGDSLANLALGGAIYIANSSPAITNCTFTANQAFAFDGHAGAVAAGLATITACTFRDNIAFGGYGGALTGGARILDSTFIGNRTVLVGQLPGSAGGAISISSTIVENTAFIGNSATEAGAVRIAAGFATLTNCLFSGNTSTAGGSAVKVISHAEPTLVNCTFSGNSSQLGWSVVVVVADSSTALANCILANGGNEIVVGKSSSAAVSFSIVEGGFPGTGNLDADPLLVDPDGADDVVGTEDDDLRLGPGSPAIDAGDSAAVPAGVTTDLDGNPRFADDPCLADTGAGAPPVVDMGALESPATSCDLDGSGAVGTADLLGLLTVWGPCPDCPPAGCPADFDGDCQVGTTDLLILLASWG